MQTSTSDWARQTFRGCDLGDKRRTNRLCQVASGLADHIGESVVNCCSDKASIEGAYRLIRNDSVDPREIAEGGFKSIAEQARQSELLIAAADTTTLSFKHSIAEDLGHITSQPDSKSKGFIVHSVLLLDGQTEKTIGLIEQSRWLRDGDNTSKKHLRKVRAYEEKESFKWEGASRSVASRLGTQMERVISVCDRESESPNCHDESKRGFSDFTSTCGSRE